MSPSFIGIDVNAKRHLVPADDILDYSAIIKLAQEGGLRIADGLTVAYESSTKDGTLQHNGPGVLPESTMRFDVVHTDNA